MKSIFAFFVAAALAVPTIARAQIVIDGSADAQYGAAIVSQKIGTSTFKNTETNIDAANGSELDAAYGTISNGVLYLVLAGNLDSAGVDDSGNEYDKLQIFFMTGPGGDHILGTNYSVNADSGQINNMGVGGNNSMDGNPGLTFDTGFAANYWIGVTVGAPGPAPTMYVNYEVICSNCPGAYLGSVVPSNTPPNNILVDNVYGIQAALNNSNTNGVQMDLSGCEVNGAPFNPQNVKTGIELAIPLSAIGSPFGQVSICAFITDEHYATMYNQVLGPLWDGTTSYCQGSFGSADAVDFSSLPGTPHYFTLTVPACNDFLLNYTSATFGSGGGVSNVTVIDSGACSWNATSNVPWITITSGLSGSGNGTISYSVASNTTINARTGSLTVSGQFATASITITEAGIFLPALSSAINIDGIADATYGCPLAVQQIGTGFGKSTSTNVLSGGTGSGGSELDAAYGMIINNVLFLTVAGNLEATPNQNEIQIFFMTGPGGQNTLTNVNPNIGPLNIMGGPGRGFTFDPGFAPNYWIGMNQSQNPYHLYLDYVQLWPGSTNASGVATNGYYVGTTTSTNGTLSLGNNPFGIQAALNDSNTNGVSGNSCSSNALDVAQSVAAAQVRTGAELAIPLAALGSPTGSIAVCVILSGGAPNHDYLSNQILSPIGTNDPTVSVCEPNLATTAAVNLGTLPGVPHFFLVGPEMAVKSVTVSNSNATVVYQTEANTNLLYRVERASGNYSTNLVWTPLSGFLAGTGGTLTQVDNSVTSKTNVYYRVQQSPNCQ